MEKRDGVREGGRGGLIGRGACCSSRDRAILLLALAAHFFARIHTNTLNTTERQTGRKWTTTTTFAFFYYWKSPAPNTKTKKKWVEERKAKTT